MDGVKPVLAALIGVILAGCAAAATPSPDPDQPSPGALVTASPARTIAPASAAVPSPSPTTAPTPSPTPAPTAPAGPLARTAVVEQDGVRVKIELERNPMPAGEVTRVTTTVRNLGNRTLHWFSDGCATPVHVGGEMPVEWRPGQAQEGTAKLFKDRVLDLAYRSTPLPGPLIRFVPEDLVGQGYGCGDVGIYHEIAPGRAIHDVRAWGGQADLRWGPPPTGPVTITGTFDWYWRGRPRNEPEYPDIPRIEVTLEAWVSGGADAAWLSPPEVVDAALADAAFVAYLETQDLGNGREEILWYRPELAAWEVGVLIWYEFPEPRLHLVVVDPHTGQILDTVDRAWDEDRDGFP